MGGRVGRVECGGCRMRRAKLRRAAAAVSARQGVGGGAAQAVAGSRRARSGRAGSRRRCGVEWAWVDGSMTEAPRAKPGLQMLQKPTANTITSR
eukprot:365004-Chlamydomonas_euryale.AAC.2